jgi:hypothetical protein
MVILLGTGPLAPGSDHDDAPAAKKICGDCPLAPAVSG